MTRFRKCSARLPVPSAAAVAALVPEMLALTRVDPLPAEGYWGPRWVPMRRTGVVDGVPFFGRIDTPFGCPELAAAACREWAASAARDAAGRALARRASLSV